MEYPIYQEYTAHYSDAQGDEATVIRNDGYYLRMYLRGVEFVGRTLDNFSAENHNDLSEETTARFTFFQEVLCSFTLDYTVPIGIVSAENAETR